MNILTISTCHHLYIVTKEPCYYLYAVDNINNNNYSIVQNNAPLVSMKEIRFINKKVKRANIKHIYSELVSIKCQQNFIYQFKLPDLAKTIATISMK